MFKDYCQVIDIKHPSIIIDPNVLKLPFLGDENESITVSLGDLDIINTTCIRDEQIIEVRRDQDANRKLQRLNVFFTNNYAGKPKSLVEDELQIIYDDYKKQIKKHGLETRIGTMKQIFSSKDLKYFLGTSFASIFLDEFELAGLTALTGLTFELGKFLTTVKLDKYKMNLLKNDHNLSYLLHLENVANK